MNKYDKIIGYAKNKTTNQEILLSKIISVKEIVDLYVSTKLFRSILIAGCGDGHEAVAVHKVFSIPVVGIDINLPKSNIIDNNEIYLLKGDLKKIPFKEKHFSFIYCYHVLEHVDDPGKVLKELKRVLSDNGTMFIGFPNRNRLLPSYFSSHHEIKILNILQFNIRDYWRKITGTFKNELGAHAGFSSKEFIKLAYPHFQTIIPIRSKWIEYQYPKFSKISYLVDKLKIGDCLYPSNIFLIKK